MNSLSFPSSTLHSGCLIVLGEISFHLSSSRYRVSLGSVRLISQDSIGILGDIQDMSTCHVRRMQVFSYCPVYWRTSIRCERTRGSVPWRYGAVLQSAAIIGGRVLSW